MIEQLYRHITKLVPTFTVSRETLAPFFESGQVGQEQLLLRENEICDTLYFVNKGCLYLFYEDNSGKQVIHFALEDWWITDYKTFSDSKPAVYSIADGRFRNYQYQQKKLRYAAFTGSFTGPVF